jgi:hypothetical protein
MTDDNRYDEYVLSDDDNPIEGLEGADPFASLPGDDDDGDDEGTSAATTDETTKDEALDEGMFEPEPVEIPEWLKKQVDTDVRELDSLPGIRANYEWNKWTGDVKIFICMFRDRFALSRERARSYMLDPDSDLCFQLTFSKHYCGDITNYQNTLHNVKPECPVVFPKVPSAKIRKRGDLKSSLFKSHDPCSMNWYLVQRLKAYLGGEMSKKRGPIAGCWPPRLEPRGFEERVETRFVRTYLLSLSLSNQLFNKHMYRYVNKSR